MGHRWYRATGYLPAFFMPISTPLIRLNIRISVTPDLM